MHIYMEEKKIQRQFKERTGKFVFRATVWHLSRQNCQSYPQTHDRFLYSHDIAQLGWFQNVIIFNQSLLLPPVIVYLLIYT